MRHEIERASLRIGAALLTCWAALGSMAEPSASRGCGAEPPAKPGTSAAFGLTSGGLDREYRLHLPPSYVADRPMSLMLDFHGYTGDAAGEEAYTGLSDHADEHGYIVVYPQGTAFRDQSDRLITSWNDLAGSRPAGPEGPICAEGADFYPHPPECGEPTRCTWATCHDDVGFIEALLDHLEEALCLDLDRVYATGMSNGGMFVHRLGCELPERFGPQLPDLSFRADDLRNAAGREARLRMYAARRLRDPRRGGPLHLGWRA